MCLVMFCDDPAFELPKCAMCEIKTGHFRSLVVEPSGVEFDISYAANSLSQADVTFTLHGLKCSEQFKFFECPANEKEIKWAGNLMLCQCKMSCIVYRCAMLKIKLE